MTVKRFAGSSAVELGLTQTLIDQPAFEVLHQRLPGAPYRSATTLVPLETVTGKVRQFPFEWMSPDRNDVTPQFLEWARPLIGRVEPYVRL